MLFFLKISEWNGDARFFGIHCDDLVRGLIPVLFARQNEKRFRFELPNPKSISFNG
jgi:hypothetical protein